MTPPPAVRRAASALVALVALGAGASPAAAYDPIYYGQSPGPFCGNPQGGQAPLRLIGDKYIRYHGTRIAVMRIVYAPACGTAWVKVVSLQSGYVFRPSVWHQNTPDTDLHEPTLNDAPTGTAYTAMIAARYNVVCGGVQAYRTYNQFVPTQGKHLSWNYLGCAKPNDAQRGHPLEDPPTPTPPPPAPDGGQTSPPPPAAATTFAETTGGVAHTWTNPANAGGIEGPTVGARQTIQIACKLTGFRVADGNTWWYRVAQTPWNNAYFVSADAFYNNGQTSGSLRGTPFVDPAVPNC